MSSYISWLVLLIVCLSFFSSVVSVKPPYKVCSTAKAHVKIDDIEVNEWPPVSGGTLEVNMTGSVDENVTSGEYTIDVTLDGIPLPAIQGDIGSFKPLPWDAGSLTMSFNQDIPGGILKGTTCTVQISAVDQNNQQLFCVTMSFVFNEIYTSRPAIHFPVKKIPNSWGAGNVVSRLGEKQQQEHRHQ